MTDGHAEYGMAMVGALELIWGEGFLSPGGPEEVAETLAGRDIRDAEVLDIGCGIGGVDLLLLNRELDWGFSSRTGVELMKKLRAEHPELKFMLVSNYPEAQAEAQEAGALPGFGKRELSSPRVKEVIQTALR